MGKEFFKRKILTYEVIGFTLIVLMIWADEVFDLPHLILGAPSTPVNLKQCMAESAFVVLFGVIIAVLTQRLLARVRHLEGSIPVCTFCRRVQIYSGWISMEEYVKRYSEADVSVGMCPACAAEHYGMSCKRAH